MFFDYDTYDLDRAESPLPTTTHNYDYRKADYEYLDWNAPAPHYEISAGAYSAEELVAIAKRNGEIPYADTDDELIVICIAIGSEGVIPSFGYQNELPF